MLPKKNRLPSFIIPKIIKKGEYIRGNFLQFAFEANVKDRNQPTRFAIIVPKKIIKKAVLRNKIKRQISESIKNKLALIKKSYNIIVIYKPLRHKNQFCQIDLEITALINRLNLL